MKKFLIILTVIVALILLAAVLVPIIFKDDIQQLVHKTLNENIDAHVFYDPSKFDLTLFKNFPNPTASIDDFGMVGKGQFEGDTLVSVGSFNISIDLFSLFGDNYKINSISLDRPNINVIVLENGDANYNIVTESEPDTVVEESSDYNLSINSWSISNGRVSYTDKSMGFSMLLAGLDHSGSGDISSDDYDLSTKTTIKKSMIAYDGTKYLNGQTLYADITMHINMPSFKFTFKNNEIRVNDFPLAFDGYVAMPGDDIEMDLNFSSANASIKSLYSLIPGVYTEGFDGVKAEGDLTFSGFAKGTYNEQSMPAFNVALKAKDGMIAYPDLPTPVKNINIDMVVDNKDGNIDHTIIDIKQFHMDLGKNPVDANLLIRNLTDYSMKANVQAKLNLADISTMFPVEGMDMKGLFALDVKADGIYDSVRNIMPAITAAMSMENGYIKSTEFPKALEDISFKASVDGASGKMEDITVLIERFRIAMEGEELSGRLELKNLVDYQWDLALKGGLDLEVISEVYPIEDMKYSGHLTADVQTAGKYSDVEAERYDRFPTSGTIALSNFSFRSVDLPQGMKISNTQVTFDPHQLSIDNFSGTVGRSDMDITGFISNYIDYIFKDNELLKGKMTLKSKVLDVNEWMSDEPTTAEDTTQMEVVEIPKNVDFEFNSSITNIYYDNLTLKNAQGLLTVRNGVLDMRNLSFDLLGGAIVMNGFYDTSTPQKPAFDYKLNVKGLSIPQAFSSFATVQTFAPMARHMNGEFSSNFAISGLLKKDLTPVYESINGGGLIEIAEAYLKESKLVTGVAGFLKSDATSGQMSLKDVVMSASLKNGRAYVQPFDVALGGQQATLAGSIGIDGSLDYNVKTEVDAGAVGQQVNQLLANLKGENTDAASSKIKLNFNVGGTYDNPKIVLAGTTNADGTTTTVEDAVKTELKQEAEKQVEAAKEEAQEKIKEETDKIVKEAEKQLQPQIDTLKKQLNESLKEGAGDVINEQVDSTAQELKKSLQDLFKKKKGN
ncbi:MAG: AsmA family protein [Cyclobacteriaceae bacterium]|nr:AsmA family protein [Cyclobacteriaceae bacterium]